METLGLYNNVEEAAVAVDRLVAAGFTEGQITSLTSVPYPDGVLVKTWRHSILRWITVGSGIAGACAGFLLAAGTAWVYPVQTGDKAIVALYPTGIITYEITMLFAMVGTIVGMFLEMKLPAWGGDRPYDARISEGYVGICVRVDDEKGAERAQQVMKETGALPTIKEAQVIPALEDTA
ncbi:DUF3341 domain-containing protein [Geomonas sp. RF6]|uniref:quinol:electron acceptor oxidoreductase subunit ActD n=1 Tax=Geomonas sp. RF6 TaxID=2897342 RepID=UPI001E3B0B88|nr:quinol:electron acceptor oxidoreductase subunit ActD [Geomonas sp. RF6]UFS70401.1 DUF3341 domain-containing protein [Geomonas sp. RF6]